MAIKTMEVSNCQSEVLSMSPIYLGIPLIKRDLKRIKKMKMKICRDIKPKELGL
jgi:hypothetical protein